MTKIYLLLLALCSITQLSYNQGTKYPNCIKTLQKQQITKTQKNSNRNFISLSSFLMEKDSKTQNYLKQQTDVRIESGQINSQKISQSSEFLYLHKYLVISGSCALLCFILVFLRAKFSYDRRMRKFIGKNMESALAPSIITTIIVCITFMGVFWNFIYKYPTYIQLFECSHKYLKDLMLYGDNRSNWAGLYGYQKLINLQIKYMETIENIPNSYKFQLLPIKNRINQRRSLVNQFLQQFSNASITYTSTDDDTNTYSINMSNLLPKLLSIDNNNRTILNKIDKSLQNLLRISKLFINIQTILNDTKQTSSKSRLSLIKMLPSYLMPGRLIQNSNIFNKQIEQNTSKNMKRILDKLNRNQYLLLFSTIFLGGGIQVSISYLFFIIILLKIRYHLILKLTNLLWLLLICILLLGIVILFLHNTIIAQLKYQCDVFENFLNNKTDFYSYYNIKKPVSMNTYKIFQPCLFQQYDRYTKQTSIGNFTNFPDLLMQSKGFIDFNTNLTTLIKMMNPSDSIYSNPFQYQVNIQDAIKYVQNQKNNIDVDGKWNYLDQLLSQLNIFTLNNLFNESCYKHRWQFSYENCPKYMNILPLRDNNLILSVSSYPNAQPTCLILTSDISQVLSNYKLNQSRCTEISDQIKNILIKIVQVMQTRDRVLQSIIQNLKQIKDVLDQYLRILRTNYILKKDMMQYVITIGRTISYNSQSIKNWQYSTKKHNNCTCIKIWMQKIYDNTCINMRSDILKTFLLLIITEICVGLLIILGFLYGVNQQIKQIQYADIDNDIISQSQDINQNISHNIIQAPSKDNKKYINEFFKDDKKNG